MNLLEAIDARKSRRTYFNIPIEKEKAAILQDLITTFNVESTLTMTFIEDAREAFNSIGKSYGMFKGVCSVMVMKGLKADFHLKEKVGYYGERLILEATCLKLGTCWVGATFDKNNILFAVPEEEELICVIPVGCVPEDETFKERMLRGMMHRKTKSIEQFYNSNALVPDWFLEAMKAVQKAPSTRNTQKVMFDYQDGKITASVPETYHFDLVDLGIAKLHFELASGKMMPWGNGSQTI